MSAAFETTSDDFNDNNGQSPKEMTLFLITVATIAFAMLIMAVGAIVAKRSLRGSCGGLSVRGPDGDPLDCEACPYRGEFPECEKVVAGHMVNKTYRGHGEQFP